MCYEQFSKDSERFICQLLCFSDQLFSMTGCSRETEEAAVVQQPGDPGYAAGETHGLIASKQDMLYSDVSSVDPDTRDPSYSDSMRREDNEEGFVNVFRWSTSSEDPASPHNARKPVPGTLTALGTGAVNSAAILAVYPKGAYRYTAAAICDSYQSEGYTDWYLPSKDELNTLYENRDAVGGFAVNVDYWSDFYWSSSESSDGDAWSQNFFDGFQYSNFKDNSIRVRAVRTF
ncbi:MAG: hypothetical protein C1942_02355 [Prosthecochloris sp.]|nr:hypothetical protein [Prosthecochloris sp.]